MCEKVKFNVIEKNKTEDIEDISKQVIMLINKLIIREFIKES